MRILDVGCGPGDVALLAAELVGESGARARAATAKNVHFLVASPDDTMGQSAVLAKMHLATPFDEDGTWPPERRVARVIDRLIGRETLVAALTLRHQATTDCA